MKLDFAESFYSKEAILEAAHEVNATHATVVEHVGERFEVTVYDIKDIEHESIVRLWFTQLVNDGQLREQLNSRLGRVRDVVIAAAFSRIAVETLFDSDQQLDDGQ
jgi:His-Xaa-Ser system protein HxsD